MELFKIVYSKDECLIADGALRTTYSMIEAGTITTNATKYNYNKSMIK